MKLYDFDGMFDKKLSAYVAKNADKYKESDWENIVPSLYEKFGDTFIKAVGNTPNGFYAAMSDEELVHALKAHLKQEIPVSEYLCKAIEGRACQSLLLPLLNGTESEVTYAMNLFASDDCAIPYYMKMLTSEEFEADRKNDLVDLIKLKADNVKEEALSFYEQGVEKEYMLEILSRCVLKDDRIFNVLLKAFRGDDENVPMHASYLAAYDDDRALPYLLDKIDEEGISYVEFQELKYAIEALGGSYEKERDFSNDPYYELIEGHNAPVDDIFNAFSKNNKN